LLSIRSISSFIAQTSPVKASCTSFSASLRKRALGPLNTLGFLEKFQDRILVGKTVL
jgi:hypothetical protein